MGFVNRILHKWNFIYLFFLCLIPLLWFLGRGDVLITGLDTNFPLNPLTWFLRRFFVWNGANNAGVDFSSSTAGLFFHFVQLAPYLLGLSLKYVEILSLVFWFFAIVFSSFFLSRVVVPNSKLAQLVFVTIYSVNTYLFNTWENVKVSNLALVASLPLFIATLYLWVHKKMAPGRAILLVCLASILGSGAGINPAYFVVIVMTLVIQTLVHIMNNSGGSRLRVFKISLGTLLVLLVVNMFWSLPLLYFLFGSHAKALNDIGFTDWLQSLSKDTSIVNIIRLQGAWDWYALDTARMPQYLPYTLNYLYKLPFIIFSFVLPFLAFFSFIFAKRENRFWYHLFGVLALLGIFFGVGSHSPTGSLYIFFTKHLPFFSFFRSPWYIFTPILIVSYAGLCGIFFERITMSTSGFIRRVMSVFGFIFLSLYLVYNYPLINGKIFRPNNNGFYIKFPNYVWETKEWLDKEKFDGRMISYPDDQLESFEWGYKGTESILSLFSNQEVVTPTFNSASKSFSLIQRLFYSQIKRGEFESAFSLLRLLGVDQIFYKKDSPTLNPPIGDGIQKLVESKNIGKWTFMKINNNRTNKIFTPTQIYRNINAKEEFAYLSSVMGVNAIVVNADDTEVAKLPFANNLPVILKAENAEKTSNEGNIKRYLFTIPKNGEYKVTVERLFLNGSDLKIEVDDENVSQRLINQNDSLIIVGPLKLSKGDHIVKVSYPESKNIVDLLDYSRYSNEANLRKEELPADIKRTMTLYSSEDVVKSAIIPTHDFNPFLRYQVNLDYKYAYGNVPAIEVTQSAPTAPVKSISIYPGSTADWNTVSKPFEPVETNSKLEVLVILPANGPEHSSKSYIENISVKRIYDNKVFVIEEPQNGDISFSNLTFSKQSPVEYRVQSQNADQNGVLVSFLESYSSKWSLKVQGEKARNIRPIHFSINGYANAWYVPVSGDSEFKIYYEPQKIFILGAIISIVSISIIIFFNLFKNKFR